jgi:methyl-accepting chemotaxis protein
MNIRNKLLIGGGLLALLPIVLTASAIGYQAYSVSRASLEDQARAKLEAVRENKKTQVEDYLSLLTRSVSALARTTTVVDAFKGYRAGVEKIVADTGGQAALEKYRGPLADYYTKEFVTEFNKRNATKAPDMAAVLGGLDPVSLAMQYHYIAGNPQPLGKKEQMFTSNDPSAYSKAHALYHPSLEAAQKKFGYYDIFLVDVETNRVIYTVFKELDFSSNLNTGVAAKTGLADVVAKASKAKSKDDVFVSDFAPYLPSYLDQAAFIAVPVYDGDKQIAVMAVQAPLDQITAAMTSEKRWRQTGLGETGETYLVGGDKRMRTDSRFVIEDAKKFSEQFAQAGGAADAIATILKKSTSIGLVRVDSEGVQKALAGETGTALYADYRGQPTLGAYAPLKVGDARWAIVSEQDASEIYAPIDTLRTTLLGVALGLGLLLVALSIAAIVYFVRQFMRPVNQLQETVQKVAAGDLAARSQVKSGDEMETLSTTLDNLLDDRISTLARAERENEQLNNSVIGVLQAVAQISQRDLTVQAPVTEDIIGTVADSINQLTAETSSVLNNVTRIAGSVEQASAQVKTQSDAVNMTATQERISVEKMIGQLQVATQQMNSVAQIAITTNAAAAEATSTTDTALATVESTVKGMSNIRETISEVEKRIKRLGERSQEISQIVNLINTISERTHVLSLNASMQAAVAGEAGRGFAVVAEEVQRLAENSRNATQQIANLVQNIQIETNDTINTVNKTIDQVVQGSEMATRSGEQMRETQATTARLVQLVEQIASSVQGQVQLASELRTGATEIGQSTEMTAQQLKAQEQVTDSLVGAARQLVDSVSVFRLPKAA